MVRREDWGQHKNGTLFVFDNVANVVVQSLTLLTTLPDRVRRAVTSSLPCLPSRRPTMSLLSGTGKLWAGTTIDCNFSPTCTGTYSSYLACGVADSISSERSVMNLYLIPFADNSDLIRSWSKVSHSDWLCDFGWSYNLLFSLLAALKVLALSDHTAWQRPLRFVMRQKACRNSSVVWPFVSSK